MQNFCAVVFPLIALLVSPPLFALFVPTWLALLLTAVVALNPLTLLLLADGLKFARMVRTRLITLLLSHPSSRRNFRKRDLPSPK